MKSCESKSRALSPVTESLRRVLCPVTESLSRVLSPVTESEPVPTLNPPNEITSTERQLRRLIQFFQNQEDKKSSLKTFPIQNNLKVFAMKGCGCLRPETDSEYEEPSENSIEENERKPKNSQVDGEVVLATAAVGGAIRAQRNQQEREANKRRELEKRTESDRRERDRNAEREKERRRQRERQRITEKQKQRLADKNKQKRAEKQRQKRRNK